MGNSLCSHPALLISDFGGICVVWLRLRIRELRKVEVSVWHTGTAEAVDRLSQRTSRGTLNKFEINLAVKIRSLLCMATVVLL